MYLGIEYLTYINSMGIMYTIRISCNKNCATELEKQVYFRKSLFIACAARYVRSTLFCLFRSPEQLLFTKSSKHVKKTQNSVAAKSPNTKFHKNVILGDHM